MLESRFYKYLFIINIYAIQAAGYTDSNYNKRNVELTNFQVFSGG
jgi:hypothetical protein